MKKILFVFAFIVALGTTALGQRFVSELTSATDFNIMKGMPLSDKYGAAEAIKVVYVINTNELFFISSHHYQYHHDFCSWRLGYNKGLSNYNNHNYSANSPSREYLLGNINYFPDQDLYGLDLSPQDDMAVALIHKLYEQIAAHSFIGNELKFILNTNRLRTANQEKKFSIPVIGMDDLYEMQTFQSISQGNSKGYLRFISVDEMEEAKLGLNDIIVLDGTPEYLPLVAGVITTEFQTPLSHLSILGRNRRIPIMAKEDVFEDTSITQLEDSFVQLWVHNDIFKISKTTKRKSIDKLGQERLIGRIKKDLDIDTLVEFHAKRQSSYSSIGSKAANFDILHDLSQRHSFKVPESAFAIPFYFYEEHLIKSGATLLLEELLIEKPEGDKLKIGLEKIRNTIMDSPVNFDLIAAVENMAKKKGEYTRLRFRSSTNAEDLDGFSGAGLYESATGILDNKERSFEKAIKKVWASLWYDKAYLEREYYRIDQSKVSMGILVHRGFPNEEANGVAITKNIYREGSSGFTINVQMGDENVVNTKADVRAEQLIVYLKTKELNFNDHDVIEVLALSNLTEKHERVLTDAEAIHLSKELEKIKKYFFERTPESHMHGDLLYYYKFGLDLEFKLEGAERELYIKQVRPYNN